MQHCHVNQWSRAAGWALLACACGGLADSRPPLDSALAPAPAPPECESGSCPEAPEPPSSLDPVPGRICAAPSPLDIGNQTELDALEGCERITGSLTVRAFANMDPSPLRSLRYVDGSLRIIAGGAPGVDVLSGFGALEEVDSLLLDGLAAQNLRGLSRLWIIGTNTGFSDATGRLLIRDSNGLRNLEGLDSLEALGSLELRDNLALTSLAGLTRAQPLQELHVSNTPLQSLEGLEALAPNELTLIETQLRDLNGLVDTQRLTSLRLSGNPVLGSLQGARLPPRLNTLEVRDSASLLDLRGLDDVREVSTLSLSGLALTDLTGLNALERVNTITLLTLAQLTSLKGLELLREVNSLGLEDLPQLASLEGLSGLASADSFTLRSSGLTSLAGLGSPAIAQLNLLQIAATSLAGLENVTISGSLAITNTQLASLDGLPRMEEGAGLILQSLGALDDLDAAQGLTVLSALHIRDTSLRHLDAFSGLREVSSLELTGNPELTQIDGLAALTRVGGLTVANNASLRSLPVFFALESLDCELCSQPSILVSENPQLESGPGLPVLNSAEYIHIAHNERLTSLDGFGALRSVYSLQVEQNPSLLTLSLPELSGAQELRIRHNPALDDAPLASLRERTGARTAKITSNAAGASLLSPCPWPADGECDELAGDCAAGTDVQDCRSF